MKSVQKCGINPPRPNQPLVKARRQGKKWKQRQREPQALRPWPCPQIKTESSKTPKRSPTLRVLALAPWALNPPYIEKRHSLSIGKGEVWLGCSSIPSIPSLLPIKAATTPRWRQTHAHFWSSSHQSHCTHTNYRDKFSHTGIHLWDCLSNFTETDKTKWKDMHMFQMKVQGKKVFRNTLIKQR